MKTSPSLKDIADTAKVSIRTVARVIKNNGYVSPETRDSVNEVIQRLGYRPNRYARSLREQRSFEITVISWTHDEIHMEKLRALETLVRRHDYCMTLLFDPMRTPADVEHVVEELRNRRPAAVAVISRPPLDDACWAQHLEEAQLPFLFIDSEDPRMDSPRTDRESGVFDAVEYLVSTGRRRVAYVGRVESYRGASARLRGYQRAVRKHELPEMVVPIESDLDKWEAGRMAVESLARLWPLPDAVQAYSDELAMSFMYFLQKQGIRVPDDIAVMGFDDRRAARFASPPLSTVKQPNEELGQVVGELLLRKIHNQGPPEGGWSPAVRPTLVIRETT